MSTFWKGMALPWGTSPSSVFGSKDDTAILTTSVQMIVLTALGERVMNPLFGSNIMSLLANPADAQSVNSCKESVRSAIAQWDNRVIFVDLLVNKTPNTLSFQLLYKIKTNQNQDSVLTLDIPVSSGILR